MLIFLFACLDGGNALLVLAMGFVGFVVHGLGAVGGIVGLCMGSKFGGLIGVGGNVGIIALCFLTFLLAISGL